MPVKAKCAVKRARGECLECDSPVLPGGAYCYKCLQRKNLRSAKYRSNHRIDIARKAREKRKERVENFRCQRCGGPMDPSEIEAGYATGSCCSDRETYHGNHI